MTTNTIILQSAGARTKPTIRTTASITERPAADNAPIGEDSPRLLTAAQVRTLLALADVYNRGSLIPGLVLVLFAGLRVVEVENLNWTGIDLDAGTLLLKNGWPNQGGGRVVQLSPNACDWLRLHVSKPFMGRTWPADCATILKNAGLNVQPIALRHTGIAFLLSRDGAAPATAYWSGIDAGTLHRLLTKPLRKREVEAYWSLTPASVLGRG